ncbi:PAS domain-containing protein [Deinococcus ruber]
MELQASQEKFSKIFDAAPLPMLITCLTNGKFVDANPAFFD